MCRQVSTQPTPFMPNSGNPEAAARDSIGKFVAIEVDYINNLILKAQRKPFFSRDFLKSLDCSR